MIVGCLSKVGVEPVVFLYAMASFIRYPNFQALVLEKICFEKYGGGNLSQESQFCLTKAAAEDRSIKDAAYALNFWSSITLLLPSMFVSILLGIASDRSRKLPMLIPLFGLSLQFLNDILQVSHLHWNVHFLLISDFLFGICGGFASVFSTCFAYATDLSKTSSRSRSNRMAAMQASISVGGTIGYALSGLLVRSFGYSVVFTMLSAIHFISFTYVMLRVPTIQVNNLINNNQSIIETDHLLPPVINNNQSSICGQFIGYLREAYSVVTRQRLYQARLIVLLVLLIIGVEDLVFSGDSSITFYYLNTKLRWDTTVYGYYKGLLNACSSAMVMFVYPLLRWRLCQDSTLLLLGILFKAIGYCIMAFTQSTWLTFCTVGAFAFNRFIITAARSILSRNVEAQEQGKAMAAVGLLQNIFSLVSAPLFNGVASWSIDWLSGLPYLIMVVCLMGNAALTGLVRRALHRQSAEMALINQAQQKEEPEAPACSHNVEVDAQSIPS